MGGHGVILELEVFHVVHGVVRLQDAIGHGPLQGFLLRGAGGQKRRIGDDLLAVYQTRT